MTDALQAQIAGLITEYTNLFPNEWEAFKKMHSVSLSNNLTKFAEVEKGYILERKLHEIPATLDAIFRIKLSEEDYNAITGSKEGARWFAKSFLPFRSGDKV